MKRIILIMFTALVVLTGCIGEDTSNCLEDMYVSFHLEDQYEPGDYDSRIGNEVLLYIFKDKTLTYSQLIPYSAIRNGTSYVIRRTPNIQGTIEFVAWAVPTGKSINNYHSSYIYGDHFDEQFLTDTLTRGGDFYDPVYHELHIGRASAVIDATSGQSVHRVGMSPAPCRIEVSVSDNFGLLSGPNASPRVLVNGVMSHMNHQKQGQGTPAAVGAPLLFSQAGVNYSTGRFGVLPSSDQQTVSVQIVTGDKILATLTLPENRLAVSGGLMRFNYDLRAPYFEITIDDWTEKIYTVECL